MNRARILVIQSRLRYKIPNRFWRDVINERTLPFDDIEYQPDRSIVISRIGLKLPECSVAGNILGSYTQLVELIENANVTASWDSKLKELVIRFCEEIYPANCAEEIYILHELLVKGDYNLYFNSPTILMDIGANVGYTSIFLAAQNPSVTIFGYEPVKVNYFRARRNLSLNPHLLARVTINQFGLLNYTGDAVMQTELDNRGRSSAVINRKLNSLREVKESTVEVQNASDVVTQTIKDNSEKTVWIKLDCEGSEYQILESLAQARVLSQITGILFEWHVIESGLDDIVQIRDVLVANGFCVYVQRGKDKSAETGLCLATRQLD